MRSLNTSAPHRFKMTAISLAVTLAVSPVALANPLGPTVVNGSASFATNGNTFTVTNSPGAIINWQQFNIGQNELTRFVQQNTQSSVLNRIGGQDPSQILGMLQSNGRVFLVNPNGVLFGSNAIIDVAGLIASSLNISNADFLANRFNFAGGGGSVANLGRITTPVGGSVFLIGGDVRNEGVITTPQGQVLLAAGNSVSLADTGTPNITVTLSASGNRAVNLGQVTAEGGRIDIYGALIDQQGSLAADLASVDAQGHIVLKASDTTTLSGSLSAVNTAGQGGKIEVLGDQVTLTGSARVDASGSSGGGTVLIGGDWQGKNPTVQNATNTTVASGARIQADATGVGDGGRVVVWANNQTRFAGYIYARGGENGGNGGAVETSGHSLIVEGGVDATANKGATGNWLLDPASYCFYLNNSSECSNAGFNAPNGTVTASTLDSLLQSSNVTLSVTDYLAFLPSGGAYNISSTVPNGRTLFIQAPYIYSGPVSTFNSAQVALDISASSTYGTSSFSGKTGVIDVLGRVLSASSQTISASGDINIGSATGQSWSILQVGTTPGSGSMNQSITAGGNINIATSTGSPNTPNGIVPYNSGILNWSLGNQTVSAANVSLHAGATSQQNTDGGNLAFIVANGNQTISATGTIDLKAGPSGVQNRAVISKAVNGVQKIMAGTISLQGGDSGSDNGAAIFADGADGTYVNQVLDVHQLQLQAGSSGQMNGTGIINAGGSQVINLTGTNPSLVLRGGGDSQSYGNGAIIGNNRGKNSGSGTQTININGGGSISLNGGDGAATSLKVAISDCLTCPVSNNRAEIANEGIGAQKIDFLAGGSLNLNGGRNGSLNSAEVWSNGPKVITSSNGAANYPNITLMGGSGGYFDKASANSFYNDAVISSSNSGQASTTINAASITIHGGGTATTNGEAGIAGHGDLNVTTTGNISLNGGNSNVPTLAAQTSVNVDDIGSAAFIGTHGNLNLKVGGNLTLQSASGASAPAIIGSVGGSFSLSVDGVLDVRAPVSPVFIGAAPSTGVIPTAPGMITIGGSSMFQVQSIYMQGNVVRNKGPMSASGNIQLNGTDVTLEAPVTAGSYFATMADNVDLRSTITANGSTYNSYFGAPAASDGKYLQAGIWAYKSFTNNGGGINTPNGYWVVVLESGVTGTPNAIGTGVLSSIELLAAGYHWANSQAETVPASSNLHFYLPLPQENHITATIINDACVNNATLCATTSSQMTSQSAQLVDSTTESGSDAKGVVTYDGKTAEKDAKKSGKAEDKEDEKSAKGQGKEATRVAARTKDVTRVADERKSAAELKQEAKQAAAEARKTEAEAKKTEAEAKKTEAEAKKAEFAVKKTESEAKKAETVARKAEDDGKQAAAEAKQADTEAKSAKTPEHKAVAESKKAEAESRKAEADAKQAEAGAKKAEVSAKKTEVESKQAEAESKYVEAGAKKAEAEAKKAESEYKQAAAESKEAKTPEQKAVAEKRAEEKRVESVQKQAEAKVKLAKADERKSEAEAKKAESAAYKTEADAKQTEADAKHDESSARKAESVAKQDESRVARAKAEGKTEEGKRAEGRQAEAEKKRADDDKKAESKLAEAEGKKAEANKQKAEAETKRAEHGRKVEAQRAQSLRSFQKAAIATMTPERLAELAALRHEYKTEVLKPALNILQANPSVANLPACGGGSEICVPARQEIASQVGQFASQMPPRPMPTVSFLPQIERKLAVLVGINNYRDGRIPTLEAAVFDVEAVGKVLQEKMGYDVRVIRDGSRADIVKSLNVLSKEVGVNDSVTIYYAGHGYLMETAKGGSLGYWLPADSSASDPSNWISNNDIAKLLGNIPAKQVMLVSDSCYSGAFTKEQKLSGAGTDAQQILGKRSVVVMSSGGEEPVSDEGKDGHSIFAYSLMNSLKNVNKFDPGNKIFENTKAGVIAEFPQVPQYGASTSAGHTAGGDYLLEVRSFK